MTAARHPAVVFRVLAEAGALSRCGCVDTMVTPEDMAAKRYVELVTERTVERFLLRLFLREVRLRGLCIVSPFITAMPDDPIVIDRDSPVRPANSPS